MTTYVDTSRSYPGAGLRFTEFCHLLADTRAELHELADQLGVPRRIFQDHPWRWHYDLPDHLRAEAVALGAVELTMHEVGALLRARRAQANGQASRVISTVTSSSAAPDEPATKPRIGGTSP